MKSEQQSICPPYAQKTDSDNKIECKFVNKRKNNETVVMIARFIVDDFTMSINDMASFCGIDPKNVLSTIKKINKRLSEGHIIIGLSDNENEKLKVNLDLRFRNESNEKDAFLRKVARVLIEYHRLAGSQIADRINESAMNVSRAIKKIRKRLENGSRIAGLTIEEHEQLRIKMKQRADEAVLEKERKAREREMARAFKEERKNKTGRSSASAKNRKRPATISAIGMAEWNMMHYDPVTGALKMPRTIIPAGLPRRYPKKQMAAQLSTPDSYLIPGVPPKSSGTAAGRRRIRIMQLS
ncbi:MAG: hypothetical protein M1119_05900 [Firmicutes bacterium]|nr:hypothetical protein [Bacillota bacterium]